MLDALDTKFCAHNSFDVDSSRLYVFFDGKLATKKGKNTWGLADLDGVTQEDLLFVGRLNTRTYFVVELSAPQGEFEFTPLQNMTNVSAAEFDMAGRALQLLIWDKTHRYCGNCGANTERSDKDWYRHCPACGHSTYPRLSPCVIMAIRKGRDILLAQRTASRHQLYTVLAGFVEPGESAEQAVCREVFEEAGIEIANVRYMASQPWPFPGQLMLGFIADYQSGELRPDRRELQNTAWFDYQNLPDHPSTNTISGRLIRQLVAEISAEQEIR